MVWPGWIDFFYGWFMVLLFGCVCVVVSFNQMMR